jgi:predicted DNA-binding protein
MSTTINFRIADEHKEHLQILAEEKYIKVSVIVRKIIIDYLEQLDNENQDLEISEEIILYIPANNYPNN